MDALEAFYSRSGTSLGLTVECFCERTPNQQVVSRINDFLLSMANRWTRMGLVSYPDIDASWICPLMILASEEQDRSGHSLFSNVGILRMAVPSMQPSEVPLDSSMWTDVTTFPLCHLFPNLNKLYLSFEGDIPNVERLYENLAFQQLTTLRFDDSYNNTAVLQDLLSQLPMLKRLHAWGLLPDPSRALFNHPRLESLTTNDGRFHDRCSAISFPSLQQLSLGHNQHLPISLSDTALSNLTALLTNVPTELRALKLGKKPFDEKDLYRLLASLPMLEMLVLQVPLGDKWETMTGTTFRSLLEQGSNSLEMPLPRLREIMVHTDGTVPSRVEDDDRGDPDAKGTTAFGGFCALRDAFIDFVEDPRRWDSTEVDAPEIATGPLMRAEAVGSLGPAIAQCTHLELARFQIYLSNHPAHRVIYQRGRESVESSFSRDKDFIWEML
ncbi:hypothetical protein BKA70DRAFT_1316504 [Coprinopsis sp. MPI-PUGE-AT-0042]|nr:hypothetical protein BKA70DRAFT_1316504 [Coprinopsis sp. MPI-PUGE-AT-0042]